MTQLNSLGGANAGFGAINNRGQVAGFAENSTQDKDCRPGVQVNGTGPQVLDFEAVIWGPRLGEIRQLPPLPGDTVAMAFGINDHGQAVGTSGTCANTLIPGFAAGPHAVLWESDGTVHDLGSLGGTVNTDILGVGTMAFVNNNMGEVTGQATLAGNQSFHPFLWTRETGMQDLGVLPGDLVGAGLGMNNRGDIVGASVSAPGPATGNPRAFLWQNGVMSDLNALAPGSPLYLLNAFAINEFEEIVGFGVQTSSGDLHAFLAQPCDAGSSTASCQAERRLRRRLRSRYEETGGIVRDRPETATAVRTSWTLERFQGFCRRAYLGARVPNATTPTDCSIPLHSHPIAEDRAASPFADIPRSTNSMARTADGPAGRSEAADRSRL